MSIIMMELAAITVLVVHLQFTESSIITVDDFPDTEKLNYVKENWVEHNVKVDTLPLNSSGIFGGRVGQLPFICYDFETCDLVSTRVTRTKRSIDGCDHQLFIAALGSNITLCLIDKDIKDEPIVSDKFARLNVTVFSKDNTSTEIALSALDLHLASGYVLEEDFASVTGFILDGHFYGTVFLKDAVHFLEPMGKESRDLHIFGEGLSTLIRSQPVPTRKKKNKGILTGRKPFQRKICDLTIVADHTFFQEVGLNNLDKTVLQMLWHVKEANEMIQSQDFDNDGTSECIGFTVSEITIFQQSENVVNLLTGNFSVPEDFLKRFSRYNFDGFCLGVLFTNRAFEELVLGLSWRGNPDDQGVGGICQSRVRIKSDKSAYSFNALFISLKSSQEERIPMRMGVLNLVHELMHSFGAKHDPEPSEDPQCTPHDKWVNGRFLMSKFSNDGHKLNHHILSPCTKSLVKTNLEAPHRVGCLKKVDSTFCGDGVVEEGEDCDCGTTLQCIASRSCCGPSSGSKNKPPCKFQRHEKCIFEQDPLSASNLLKITQKPA